MTTPAQGTPEAITERIMAAAILDHEGNPTWIFPPARHPDIMRHMLNRGDPLPIVGEQGFMTTAHRFVGRKEARSIAEAAGQLLPTAMEHTSLFSEDVWETPSIMARCAEYLPADLLADLRVAFYTAERTAAATQVAAARATALAEGERRGIERAAEAVEHMPNLLPITPKHVRGMRGSDAAAAIRALGPSTAGAWRPIATAPKDGSHVLLSEVAGIPVVAFWNGRSWDDGDFQSSIDWATHWQPLPAPPVTGIPDAQQEGV